MKKIAIIPARGGSKRIPKKNIKLFLGKPIIAYSIEAALNSGAFDEVMVSTDNQDIAKIAIKHGANVPFLRSAKNSDDFATTSDVLLEVLSSYSSSFEYACCIYATAPFVNQDLLKQGLDKLDKGNFSSVFPVLPFSFPIQRALKVNSDSKMDMFEEKYKNTRSQDLEKAYHDAGQFYWFRVNDFLESKNLYTDNSGVVILDELQAQDIDSEVDWQLAELKYQLQNKST